jgi:PIN domain nuclease of toxin-antitoxin system
VPVAAFVFKTSLGKLRLAVRFGTTFEASGFAFLSLTLTHVEEVAALPLHHRDAFDRMLVAQTRVEILNADQR